MSALVLGPVGAAVALRLRPLRKRLGLSQTAVSELLADLGRPIGRVGVGSMELGERRIDVDDLVALAQVLDVAAAELLLGADAPPPRPPSDRTQVTCPKCGHANVVTRYQAAGNGCRSFDHYKHAPHGERFERTCQGCKYAWHTEDVLTPEDVP